MKQLYSSLICSAALIVIGCGLDDYQARMKEQVIRMELFDDEDKALEMPVDQPVRKTKDKKEVRAWPVEIFVRPPKDHDRQEKDFTVASPVFLYRFAGQKGFSFFVAASKIGSANKEGQFQEGELSVVEFRNKVLQALKEYYRSEYPGSDLPVPPIDPKNKFAVQPKAVKGDLPEISYIKVEIPDRAKAKDPTNFQVYFHEERVYQVAIIYQTPKKEASTPDFEFKRNYSLKSLDMSEKAAIKRQEIISARRNAPQRPRPEEKKDKK